MGRRKHILQEQNYSFAGYFKCETGRNISAHFLCETRAVSEKEALNNIRFQICKDFNLFYGDRPLKIDLYSYTLKVITTPIATPSELPEPIKKDSTLSSPLKKGSRLPFDDD